METRTPRVDRMCGLGSVSTAHAHHVCIQPQASRHALLLCGLSLQWPSSPEPSSLSTSLMLPSGGILLAVDFCAAAFLAGAFLVATLGDTRRSSCLRGQPVPPSWLAPMQSRSCRRLARRALDVVGRCANDRAASTSPLDQAHDVFGRRSAALDELLDGLLGTLRRISPPLVNSATLLCIFCYIAVNCAPASSKRLRRGEPVAGSLPVGTASAIRTFATPQGSQRRGFGRNDGRAGSGDTGLDVCVATPSVAHQPAVSGRSPTITDHALLPHRS